MRACACMRAHAHACPAGQGLPQALLQHSVYLYVLSGKNLPTIGHFCYNTHMRPLFHIVHGNPTRLLCLDADRAWLWRNSSIVYEVFCIGTGRMEKKRQPIFEEGAVEISPGEAFLIKEFLASTRMTLEETGQPNPVVTKINQDFLPGVTLRDYQVAAANQIFASRAGIVEFAVNAGKTEIMAAVARAFTGRVLVVCHSADLAKQLVTNMRPRLKPWMYFIGETVDGRIVEPEGKGNLEAGEKEVGFIGSGVLHATPRVCVGIDKSVARRRESLKFDHILVDECHRQLTPTMESILWAFPGATVHGLSGTPFRKNTPAEQAQRVQMIRRFGPVLQTITTPDLVDRGISAEGILFFVRVNGANNCRRPTAAGNIALHRYRALIVNNSVRNYQIGNICIQLLHAKKVVCVSFRLHEHLSLFLSMIQERVPLHMIAVLRGGDKDSERESALAAVRSGKARLLLTTEIFTTGISVPELDAMINGAGGESNFCSIQRFGRVLRGRPGKKFMYFDFIDESHKNLTRHSNARLRDIEKEYGRKAIIVNADQRLARLSSLLQEESCG